PARGPAAPHREGAADRRPRAGADDRAPAAAVRVRRSGRRGRDPQVPAAADRAPRRRDEGRSPVTTDEPAVQMVGLRKTYSGPHGDVPAVRGIDLEFGRGELFGLLGPNGAGKSTTIGMLTTLVIPTAGQAYVCGLDVVRRPVEVKRR